MIKNIKLHAMSSILIISFPVLAVHPQIDKKLSDTTVTLCKSNEDIYFNAKLENRKYVSLCGAGHRSPSTGYVKYRYGTSDKVELEYPERAETPKGKFLSYHIRLGKLQGRNIFFYSGDYRYSIGYLADNCSLHVYKGSELVFSSSCEETSELNTFGGGQSSGSVILEEELIKRFPEQFQDPNEPEFH